jgi:hypothetical protein
MWISVKHDIDAATRGLDDFALRQVPFATAAALTDTAKDGQSGVQDSLSRRFTLRNNYVRSGIRITPATKATMMAVVGSLEPFMEKQETGGTKTARDHSRVAVPVEAKRSKRDLIPKGQRPGALRGKPKVLAWKGSNILRRGGAFGILERVGKARYPLRILYWLKRGVHVKPRLGFKPTVEDIVHRRFGPHFVRRLEEAKATAR